MDEKLRFALEKENEQYLKAVNSANYQMGKRVREAKQLIKKGKINNLIKKMFIFSHNKQLPIDPRAQKFFLKAPYLFDTLEHREASDQKKTVVYTCIMGNYDEPCELLYQEPGIDYFLITDMETDQEVLNGWRVMSMAGKFKDAFTGNRYCKMHPFELFPDYDLAIYLDGNVRPVSDISRFGICAFNSKTGIAAHGHPERTCVYDEAKACILKGRGSKLGIETWQKTLRKEGMPEKYGLLEMSVIYYDLHSELAKGIADVWWETLMSSTSKRDQLVLPYVAWKRGFQMQDFGIVAPSLRSNYAFSFKPWHDNEKHK